MATCRECIYYKKCVNRIGGYYIEKVGRNSVSHYKPREFFEDYEHNCPDFKSKPDKVKRERGEWKYLNSHCRFVPCNGGIKCTNCGAVIHRLVGVNFNFCPNCGADMRKEDNNA